MPDLDFSSCALVTNMVVLPCGFSQRITEATHKKALAASANEAKASIKSSADCSPLDKSNGNTGGPCAIWLTEKWGTLQQLKSSVRSNYRLGKIICF